MRRPTAAGVFLLAALALAGCGKKPKPASEPDPAPPPAAGDVTPVPTPAPAPTPAPPDTPMPATAPNPIPPFVAYGPMPTPQLPTPPDMTPVAPMPAAPGTGTGTQPAPMTQPLPPPPPESKDKDKGGSTSVKAEWPKDINGKTLPDYLKDTVDLDPAVRERSLRTIPNFGPEIVKKELGWPKAVLARMSGEKELDPGVRAAAYESLGAVGLEKDADIKEAVRLLAIVAEQGASGGGARLHAIQTLSAFGSKAEGAIGYLIGPPIFDKAYETRRTVAFTLGRISFNEHSGPSHRTLDTLFKLASDHSAPVRMEAYQSLVILGPPLLPRDAKSPPIKDAKLPQDLPKTDDKVAGGYIAIIKKRLAPAPPPAKGGESPSPTGLVERDKQVEIMARFVMIRFDSKEATDENLGAIAKYANDKETGVSLQAINILGLLGPAGAKKMDDVVRALGSENIEVVMAAATALVQFGPASKPAIPAVERLRTRGMSKEEKEFWQKLTDQVVKLIKDSDKQPDKKP